MNKLHKPSFVIEWRDVTKTKKWRFLKSYKLRHIALQHIVGCMMMWPSCVEFRLRNEKDKVYHAK